LNHRIAHFDGVAWKYVNPVYELAEWPVEVWPAGGEGAWLLTNRTLSVNAPIIPLVMGFYRFDGSSWVRVGTPLDGVTNATVSAIWGSSAADVWAGGWTYENNAGGRQGAHRSLALRWERLDRSQSGSCASVVRAWDLGEMSGRLLGHPIPLSREANLAFDGTSWSPVDLPGGVNTQITGNGPNDIWLWRTGTAIDPVTRLSVPTLFHRQANRCGDGVVAFGEQCDPARRGPDGLQCEQFGSCLRDGSCSGPDGSCESEIAAMAGSSDAAEVRRQLADPRTPLAALFSEATAFTQTSCANDCP
jgi:hypothetical protein